MAAGELLVELEDRELRAAVDRARAGAQLARARLGRQRQVGAKVSAEELRQAHLSREQAQREAGRMEALGRTGAVTQKEVDDARSGGRSHRGTDVFARRGTPVLSAARGVVWKVGDDSLGGRVVMVLGEGRAFYYYAHLDHWAEGIGVGDEVLAGQVLGFVGNTGNAVGTPPHLHFGVYRVGLGGVQAVDPVPLLAGAPLKS